MLASLGVVCRDVDRLEEALSYSLTALDLARTVRNSELEAHVLSSLAEIYVGLGRYSEAESSARAACARRSAPSGGEDGWAYYRLGRVLVAGGHLAASRQALDRATRLAEAAGDHDLLARVRACAAAPHTTNGDAPRMRVIRSTPSFGRPRKLRKVV